ncbi:MAG: DMT family transporter, partial [Bacteroidota bacterium]
ATNQLLFLYGLSMTSPINAAIIMTSNPILVLIAAAIMLKERISWRRIGGIGLGMAGAITLIVMNQGEGLSSGNGFGDLMVLINATSYGVYLVLVKPLMGRYHPLTVMKWIFTFGLFLVVPFGLEQFLAVEWSTMPGTIWGEAAFVVVGTTFLAYLFNIFGLKHLSPATVSAYIYLQPVLAAMVALLLGKDLLDPVKIIAAILIFTGVYLVSKK